MPLITNKQKRAWIVPAIEGFSDVILNPGQVGNVPDDHWNTLRKGNRVIEALLANRLLTIGSVSVDVDELENPESPKAPEELTQAPTDSGVTLEKKDREIIELKTGGDAPAEVKVTSKKK